MDWYVAVLNVWLHLILDLLLPKAHSMIEWTILTWAQQVIIAVLKDLRGKKQN